MDLTRQQNKDLVSKIKARVGKLRMASMLIEKAKEEGFDTWMFTSRNGSEWWFAISEGAFGFYANVCDAENSKMTMMMIDGDGTLFIGDDYPTMRLFRIGETDSDMKTANDNLMLREFLEYAITAESEVYDTIGKQ